MAYILREFVPPEGSCHQYVVGNAKDLREAMKMFIDWQRDNLKQEERWPVKTIKNKDNWTESDITLIL